MPSGYTLIEAIPGVEVYRALRVGAGLSAKTADAAARGLPNSCFAVQVLHDGVPVGMGRVIGDGGCFYQVVDIAVLPAHQGQGLGKRIMDAISAYLRDRVPASAYVSLIADGQAHRLYAQYGFAATAPASIGMALVR
ncbi:MULTISPECIES: GNAT family N-acetyltransferase [Pseudoxanthomonas]|uniref:N-acetyltransferase n=1 Tax=Pseudoxanthomonas winnipegensis TaxID=2480810 RepID=A0A4Q8LE48_9GAMM|nr:MULTISPECIES: GNAT family N-acetyltransferase [Pseudoxanthomonas]PZP60520.1 MAG: N-acetyltransferase [Pseudoxanthomonas spadix]TAA26855.1 N-acetyltransferase [Pseudoxanthomonas winnipegensis]TMN16709.1 GNAT family N-acetyltransferase [Pseudoxanthomonas sp. X-1]UAY75503.1 GNAT family N-acetyltransferase [Pseudoxanthomonas sp. X-1]